MVESATTLLFCLHRISLNLATLLLVFQQSEEGSRVGHHRLLHPGLRDDVPGAHVRGRGLPHRRQLHLPLHQGTIHI